MSNHRGYCCCETVGVMCNAANFTKCKTKFEKLYEGKANVVRVDSIDTLKQCSVVFFGIIDVSIGTATSFAGNCIESVAMATASCYTDGSTGSGGTSFIGTGSAASLSSELTSWVQNGGKAVAVSGDLNYASSNCVATTSFPRVMTEAELNSLNNSIDLFRGQARPAGSLIGTADFTGVYCGTTGYQQYNTHFCSSGQERVIKHFAKSIESITNVDDRDVFNNTSETPNSQNVHFFSQGAGNSSGGTPLVTFSSISYQQWGNVNAFTNVSSLTPASYEKIGKGYIVYYSFARAIALVLANTAPTIGSTSACQAALIAAGYASSAFINPFVHAHLTTRAYDGQYWGLANRYFFHNLLRKCASC